MKKTRVIAALAAAVLVSACGAQGLPGAVRTSSGQVEALRRTKPAPATTALDFSHMVVNEVSALRDGGTIIAKGYVDRSTYVTIKFDGALASPTRGTLLVASHEAMQPEGAFRPATSAELAPIAQALRGNATRAGAKLDVKALSNLAEIVEKLAAEPAAPAAGKLTGLAIEKLPVRCPCFELKATYDGKALAIRFEGMPGGYTIETVELGGRQVTGAERAPIAAALKAAAADAGARAGMVEDVAEAMLAQ